MRTFNFLHPRPSALVGGQLLALLLARVSWCAAALLALTLPSAAAGEQAFPQATWQTKAPAELGLDPWRLQAVEQALGGRGCIVKDGYVVHSWGSQSEVTDWYSSAKPVLSTLLMFAMQEGKVSTPDALVADFGWDLLPKDRGMTLRHLASMTSGYARPEAPGAAWSYNDYAIQLYQKTLFDKILQDDPDKAANAPQRFGALQLEDGLVFRKTNRRLSASVRDFSRIAWFWLNRGHWNGRQVLPAKFFDENMRPQVPKDLPATAKAATNDYLKIGTYGGDSDHFAKFGPGIYGFNWWFNDTGRLHPDQKTWPDAPDDAVMSLGFAGNSSVIMPKLNLAVACASGDWGKTEAGESDSVQNQRLRLIAWAGTPVKASGERAATEDKAATLPASGAAISGELKQWHRVTLSFRGSETSETDDNNPFLNGRLQVKFTQGDRSLDVPGYFAADGNAGETGAKQGNCWRVHFSPPATGRWQWQASFRSGENVAVSDDPAAGKPAAPDGARGEFDIKPSDKTGADFRGKGLLQTTGGRYLRFAGNGEYFLKGGADSPENLLAFADFDDTVPTHRYGPHALDYRAGDPAWRDGKGKNLIGAMNYLGQRGVNSIYVMTMNVKGDGKDVWPWIADQQRTRYDCSKLDQWEILFSHLDKLGIMLHLVLQEQENDQLLDGGELGSQRRLYFRELIARFGHHPAITWNLGEENTNTDAQRRAMAAYFHDHDPYRHMVVIHTFPRMIQEVYTQLLGFPLLDGISLQTNDTHKQTLSWIERSIKAGRPWIVSLDEIGPADTGVKPDSFDFNHDEVRKLHLWGHLMAGGAGIEWLFGYKYPHHDVNLEDFRSRDQMWRQTTIAVNFFKEHLPFQEMQAADELATPAGCYCFAKPGRVYAVYCHGGEENVQLQLPEGNYSVGWFYPKLGGKLHEGSVPSVQAPAGGRALSLGKPPRDPDKDWLILVRKE